ncbi:MAG TPA: dual specificity protein phosphatase [Terriglobales bacterium]|nr:dual specificity protein phosphatase [Terriglobales bacterium]
MKTSRWSMAANRMSAALERHAQLCASGVHQSTATHGTSGMDMTWVTGRIAVGGGIWSADNMAEVARAGITHIIDMQIEFDDTALAEPHGIEVLWNATDDDFQPKSPELLQRGVDFAFNTLDQEGTKLFIHCAAGVHRAPMMTLAVLTSLGWKIEQAIQLIEARRPVVDFAEVYVQSVQRFLEQQGMKQASGVRL